MIAPQQNTQFIDDAPDSRTPGRAPDAPDSLGDVLGAHWTLGRQDFAGAPEQAEIDAYGPVVTALGGNTAHYVQPYAASPVSTANVWEDVARRRKADPSFLKDVPAANAAEFSAWVQQREAEKRRVAQSVVSRETGGQKVVGFAADIGTGLLDPVNLMTLPLAGPIGGASKTIFGTVAREALVNSAIETAELPSIASNRAQFGEEMTGGEMLGDVGMAALGGGAFGLGGVAAKAGGRAVLRSEAGKALGRRAIPLAMRFADPARVNDGEVARTFAGAVPAEYRSPDEIAALHVIDRQEDIDAASPFVPNATGMQTHADRLSAALADVLAMPGTPRPATAARLASSTALSNGTVAPPNPRETLSIFSGAGPVDLTPDRVIGFVMTDLEGGAKVVHYSDADGGTTKFGIAAAHNPGVDVANLTAAEAARIAKAKYWLPEFDRADPRAAAVAFDASYIGGPELGRRILAESGGDPARALDLYRAHLDHLAGTVPGKARYRDGWNNRVDKLARFVGGDGERPMLKPEPFDGDDEAMRWAQRALDEADLDAQMRASEAVPEPDSDFAPEPEAALPPVMEMSAAPDDAPAIEMPTAGEAPAPETAPAFTDPAEIRAAVLDYAGDRGNSIHPEKVARALGVAVDQAETALGQLADRGEGGLIRTRGKWDKAGKLVRAPRIMRSPARRGPEDLLYFLARRGGIRNEGGHDLIDGRGLQQFVPGAGMLIRDKGMTLDRARELVAESGYFHDIPPDRATGETTIDDFLEMLDRASETPHYTLDEVLEAEARDAERERAAHLSDIKDRIDARLTEHGFGFDRAQLTRAADKIEHNGLTIDEAIVAVANEDMQDALDALAIEGEDGRYDDLADDFADIAAGDARPHRGGDARPGADATSARVGETGADQLSGAAADDAEAQGLNGPPPLDPKVAGGVDDPDGAQAERIADSLEHDARADLDRGAETDPNLVDRQRQQAQLGADSPMRGAGDQDSTIGAPLFDHADQFRIDLDGGERSTRDILDELDADQAAIDAARRCL